MKVLCRYRRTPYGEIITSNYDTVDCTIDGVDRSDFYAYISVGNWWEEAYTGNSSEGYPIEFMDIYMLMCYDCLVTIECCKVGFYAIHRDGTVRWVTEIHFDSYAIVGNVGPIFQQDYILIGNRPTRTNMMEYVPKIYKMVYDRTRNLVMTGEGNFIPEFDISRCLTGDVGIKGYANCIKGGYFGVVYYDGEPTMVITSGDKLKLYKGGNES